MEDWNVATMVNSIFILVIDDDPAIVSLVETALDAAGYHALSGLSEDALRLARELHPSAILLDLLMPGMSGPELSQRLRTDHLTADIPIIAMSKHLYAPGDPRLGELSMYYDDLLVKPIDLDQLYGVVAYWAEHDSGLDERRVG